MNFLELEPCRKFLNVLISFHEVIKLQSFQFDLKDAISANVEKNSRVLFFKFFGWFYGEPNTKFHGVFDLFFFFFFFFFILNIFFFFFFELIKLRSFQWLVSWHNWRPPCELTCKKMLLIVAYSKFLEF